MSDYIPGQRSPEQYRAALAANEGTGPLGGTPAADAAKTEEGESRNQAAWDALGPAADADECSECDGSGECSACDGEGEDGDCLDCSGSGDCTACDGTGGGQ